MRLLKAAKSALGIALSAVIAFSVPLAAVAVDNDAIGQYDYTITNPYKNVNWDTWKGYRGATHVHTVRSDGNVELNDMIEKYYALGYEALALTDHGTVNYSWTKDQNRLAIFGYQYFVHGNVDEISDARYKQITTGSDRGGDGMTEVPLGIELNGSSTKKCHVNSYFADCGHGDLGVNETWPENAVKKSQDAGGICHINHVGEWSDGKDNIGTYDSTFVSKFANIFLNYSACVGMELVNTTDNRTHNDRYLYDETLKLTAPNGRNVYGFCEDDSHDYEDCGNNAQFFMMPSNTQANIRTSMETGAFFACSKNAKTAAELGDGFAATGDFPMVSRISVDENKDQISVCAYNGSKIKMVADGNVIAEQTITSNNQTITFDLNDYESSIGSYVRFYITGAGGICYVQPFLLTRTTYSTSTVQFTLPSADAKLTVKDSNGNTIEPANSNNYYILSEGTYTYTASLSDYEPKTESFTVTAADITTGKQIKIPVTLDKITLNAISSSTTVDHVHHFIYGVNPGTTDLSLYVKPVSGAEVTYKGTARGFGTGSTAFVKYSLGSDKTYSLVIFGDVDGDGMYDGQDATIVTMMAAGMLTKAQVGDAAWFAADCNHDGLINSADIEIISNAGVLLSKIEQGNSNLTTSSVYSEYLSMISQEVPSDEETQVKPDKEETKNTDNSSKKSVIESIISLIKTIISKIFDMIK
jgi:hypothetical protein